MGRLAAGISLALFLLLSASSALCQTTKDPAWVSVLSSISPLAKQLIDLLFKKDNSDKLNRSVREGDAQHKLDGLAARMQQAIQPVNDEVKEITALRDFMDELDGIGSLPEDGSFSSSIVQIETYARASQWCSDDKLPTLVEEIEKTTGLAGRQWDLLWNRSQDKAMPDNIRSKVAKLRRNFTDLVSAVVESKEARTIGDRRSSLLSVSANAHSTGTQITGVLASWDNWHRDLGEAFLEYMRKFGAEPDSKTVQDSLRSASASLEVSEAEQALNYTNAQLDLLSIRKKAYESNITQGLYGEEKRETAKASGADQTYIAEAASVQLLKDGQTKLDADVTRLEEQKRAEMTRVDEARQELKKLSSRPLLSSEELARLLAGGQLKK